MAGRLEGVRVLIVDDDEDVLEAIDTAMRAEGAETQTVREGNAAVAACQDNPPDIVVLDMMLPRRSGFLVLEKIKGREDSPLVIMVTANEGKRHQAYAESLGVDKYLLKPVPLERLIDVAVDLLDKEDEADGEGDDEDDGDGDELLDEDLDDEGEGEEEDEEDEEEGPSHTGRGKGGGGGRSSGGGAPGGGGKKKGP